MRLATAFSILALLAACGGETAPTDTGAPPDMGPPAPECFFDNDKSGKNVGDHVKNIKVLDTENQKFELHDTCGVAKAVWIVLATGW